MRDTLKHEIKPTKELRDSIRERRMDAGISVIDMAFKAGLSQQTIINIEKGHVPNIRKHTFHKLATALGLSTDELLSPVGGTTLFSEEAIVLPTTTIDNIMASSMRAGHGDDIEGYLELIYGK